MSYIPYISVSAKASSLTILRVRWVINNAPWPIASHMHEVRVKNLKVKGCQVQAIAKDHLEKQRV